MGMFIKGDELRSDDEFQTEEGLKDYMDWIEENGYTYEDSLKNKILNEYYEHLKKVRNKWY